MPNTVVPQSNFNKLTNGETGKNFSGPMALDNTKEKQEHTNDWVKYLVGPAQIENVQKSDTQVKQLDQAQYFVEHQADAPQDPITPKIAETKINQSTSHSELIIGGEKEITFNNAELKIDQVKEADKPVVQEKNEIPTYTKEKQMSVVEGVLPETEKAKNEGLLKKLGVDFGLFNNELVQPGFKAVKETTKAFYGSVKELFVNYIFFKLTKPKTEEEKKKEATQAANKRSFFESLKMGMMQMFGKRARRNAMRPRIQEVNRTIGNQNVNYEGILNENDEIREEVLLQAEKANSEKTKAQIAADKRRKMMSAMRGSQKKGPGITFSQDLAHNANNAAKLAG